MSDVNNEEPDRCTDVIEESRLLLQRMQKCNLEMSQTIKAVHDQLYEAREVRQELSDLYELAKTRQQRGDL